MVTNSFQLVQVVFHPQYYTYVWILYIYMKLYTFTDAYLYIDIYYTCKNEQKTYMIII